MNVLWAIAALLIAGWVFGFVVLKVSSALLHLLLVVAVVTVLARLFARRRSV